jgi:hypothetical protein
MPNQRHSHAQEQEPLGCLAAFARLYWLGVGFIVLLVFAAFVAKNSAPIASDIGVLIGAALLIAVRYIDVVHFNGYNADEKPSTVADWRRYSAKVVVFALGVWGLARVAAYYGWA